MLIKIGPLISLTISIVRQFQNQLVIKESFKEQVISRATMIVTYES